jgi:predicted phosphodiesterase
LFVLLALAAAAWAQTTAPASGPTTAPTTAPTDLLAGASWQYSTDGGRSFSPQWPADAKGPMTLMARAEFPAGDTARAAGLELTHDLETKSKPTFALDGTTLEGPHVLGGVFLRTIPAIDPHVLAAGTNALTMQWQLRKGKDPSAAPHVSLSMLHPSDLKLLTGPILGARGDDYITISCRTNLPAQVTVRLIGGFADQESRPGQARPALRWHQFSAVSTPGLFHQFRIDGLAHMASATYQIQAETADGAGSIDAGPWSVAPLAAGQKPLRFVALGDSRTHPENWAPVATAAFKARPQWIIHTGDLVGHGREDWLWNEELFHPAATLLGTVPTFVAVGNHDEESPLVSLLFALPPDGTTTHWQQTIGPVHLIGIDGQADWSERSDNVAWLEGALAGSQARFIFLITHYPAWTSGKHGKLSEEGEPTEQPTRRGQEVLLPLLARYHATAMIAGHDHFYERSEPPGGVTVVTTGGGGAPLREAATDARTQNPYSKIVASVLHYCLFTIEGDTCTMEVFTPDGRRLDTRSWQARPGAPTTKGTLTTQPSGQ